MRLDENRNQFGRHGTGAGGDRGRIEQREESQSRHRQLRGRSASLDPDHAAADDPPPFIDDIDSVSSFPPLLGGSPDPLPFVNSFSQFKRWPCHSTPLPGGDPNHHPDHTLHKSVSTPLLYKPQMDDRSADLSEIRISDGEKLAAAAAAANLGYTNSFTKDRMMKMGPPPASPSPSPSPSRSPPLNPFRTTSNSSSTDAEETILKTTTHVVVGGITCPMVRKLSLLRHRNSTVNGKMNFIKT